MTKGLAGLRVLCLESRRATEIAELVRRHGGEPIAAPAMREVPLEENAAATEFAARLAAGEVDVAIFLTGVGTRLLAKALAGVISNEALGAALRRIVTVARGPKPRAALGELGVVPTVVAPEPNTWREILEALDGRIAVAGKRVAVQEYGATNPELAEAIERRGGTVLRVPVYQWALPHDLVPLRRAIAAIEAGEVDVAVFTSATQVEHLFRIAGDGGASRLREGLRRAVVASIGPVCNEALARHGVAADVVPEHPKMGHLVRAAAEAAARILADKRESLR
jgi:uroporphyrinogen-III synthase